MLETDDFISCGVESDNDLIELCLHGCRIAGILDQHHARQRERGNLMLEMGTKLAGTC